MNLIHGLTLVKNINYRPRTSLVKTPRNTFRRRPQIRLLTCHSIAFPVGVVQLCILLHITFSCVAPFRSKIQSTTIREMYKDINYRYAFSNLAERLLLCLIRPAARNWRGKDPADPRIPQTTSLRLEIPANHH